MNAMQKSIRLLYRDYFELELSQSSKTIMDDFTVKAIARTEETLSLELQKYARVGTVGLESPIVDKINFCYSVDGMQNLTRALPFFSLSVCAYKIDDVGALIPQSCIIDFPALGQLYYAEKGAGTFLVRDSSQNQSIRLKTSRHTNPRLVLTSNDLDFNVCERRSFGSFTYELCLLAAGKVDIVSYSNTSPVFQMLSELVVGEAGGKIIGYDPLLILSNGHCNI
jgi:fructose-1,6-bisphosphatase/inositol monophosphatase family enzyme